MNASECVFGAGRSDTARSDGTFAKSSNHRVSSITVCLVLRDHNTQFWQKLVTFASLAFEFMSLPQ